MGNKSSKTDNIEKQSKKVNNEGDFVIGVDFGSSGTAFAYGIFGKKRYEPITGYFDGQTNNNKISTEIILDDDLNILAFGNDCVSYLSNENNKKFHHFQNIKMNLYKKKDKVKARNSDKEVDIEKIIELILIEIKKKATDQIRRNSNKLNSKEELTFHWVITVPAIWDTKSKQIMINAADKAGLFAKDDDPSNFFALEPEAASIYYHNSPNASNDLKDFNEPFILCDIGGGTVDIVTQVKIKNKEEGLKFKELYPPLGGDNGCNKINEFFMEKVIKELFGKDCFNNTKKKVCETMYNKWIELEKKIEEFKKSYIKKDQLNSYFIIDCEIFYNYYSEEKKINQLIKDFNSKKPDWKLNIDESSRTWKIKFPYQIIEDFLDELKNMITNYISQILVKVKNIKYFIMTGGGSVNPILQEKIQNSEVLKNINFVESPNPEIAIAYGAVLFSYDHNIISPRKAKYTFGIKSLRRWNEEIHGNGGIKIYDDLKDEYKCANCFSKFITINEDIRNDQYITHQYLMSSSEVTIKLYKTKEKNVVFIDEQNEKGELKVTKFAEFTIDVGQNFDTSNRKAEVKMKLGGTFLSVSAIYCLTGEDAKIKTLYE